MIIDGYKVRKLYPFIIEAVHEDTGEVKYFSFSYAELTQSQRDAQNEYWESVEAEFQRQDRAYNERPARRWYL